MAIWASTFYIYLTDDKILEDLKTLPSFPSPSSARTGEVGGLEKAGGFMKSSPLLWADASSCHTVFPSI